MMHLIADSAQHWIIQW